MLKHLRSSVLWFALLAQFVHAQRSGSTFSILSESTGSLFAEGNTTTTSFSQIGGSEALQGTFSTTTTNVSGTIGFLGRASTVFTNPASTFTVSGGQGTSPYYNFTDGNGQTPDFGTLLLNRGTTYEFSASGVSTSHPFMVGESYGDMNSSLVSGGPLTGTGGKITLTIPSDFNGSLYYFCTNHSGMVHEFKVRRPNHLAELNSTVSMEMIWVEPGTFTMGQVGVTNASPEHNVTLTKGFYLAKYEVTQAQYEAVMTGVSGDLNATPSNWHGYPNRPVEKVSWDDIQVFLTRLNEQQSETLPNGWAYVLPTEAQWEYACRAGTTTAYSWGDSISASDANWNHGNDANQTENVGQYSANPWGFFDMHGNVWEWTADWYGAYSSGAQTDPGGPTAGSTRVYRGGSWYAPGSHLRSAYRNISTAPSNSSYSLGFRVGFQKISEPPTDLNSTAALTIAENQPIGTFVGEFNATDPEGGAITYHFVNGDNNNSLFTLDANGTLKTATVFDYESNASSYTTTIQAKDELNATTEGNFTVTLEDIFEDLDGDGTEDHLDDDMDGDGFTNAEELAIGSDPRSAVGFPLNNSSFYGAIALWFDAEQNATALYGHISDWNVSAVTTMANAFKDRSTFNEDISNWDTSNVIYMDGMFYGATSFNQAIGHWNTSSIRSMLAMFGEAESFNQDLSDWDTSSVSIISRMFEYASAFNGDITSWDTSSLVSMNAMFRYTDNFNQDLSDWNVSSMTNLYFGVEVRALSNLNKRAIHASFSSNENWGHNWGPHDANSAPIDLNSTTALTLAENQPVGTFIGEFNATDLEGDAFTFNLPAGENNNSLFSIETNGTLRSAATFDYETDSSYTITVQAKDEYNATSEQNFIVSLEDIFEDLDGDQIEDHLDDDMDGDGFTNEEEFAYPSDPRDPNSVANATPQNLDFFAPLKVRENKSPGMVVGRLVSSAGSSIGEGEYFELVEGEGAEHNSLFTLHSNGLLTTMDTFDYEGGMNRFLIRARVNSTNPEDFAEQVFVVHLLDDPYENNPYDSEQGGSNAYSGDTNSSDYEQFGVVTPIGGWSDANETAHYAGQLGSSDINSTIDDGLRLYAALTLVENEPVGTLVGRLGAEDADNGALLTYAFAEGQGSENNSLFHLDSNGTLTSREVLDYEVNASEYSIRARVTDERGASLERAFIVYLLDMFEDLDGDGTEDHLDDDMDGDGYTNEEELAYPSDPRDPNSLANRPPHGLFANAPLQFYENQPVGTEVGFFSAQDPEGGPIFFSIATGENEGNASQLFDIDENGTLKTKVVFDYESNSSVYLLVVQVADERGDRTEKTFEVDLLDLDEVKPVVFLVGPNPYVHEAGFSFTDPGAYWQDNFDGEGNVTGFGEVNEQLPGDYQLTYTHTDVAGNVAEQVHRLVEVRDTIAPVLSLNVQSPIIHPYREPFSIPQAEAYDFVDGNLTSAILHTGVVNHMAVGEYQIVYSVIDSNGNEAEPFVLTVLVDDSAFDRTPQNLVSSMWIGVEENQPVGSFVGEFNATDPDEGEISYSLVDGVGADDNHRFLMDANGTLRTKEVFDYEEHNLLTVRVRAQVNTGHSLEEVFSINIWDQVAPLVETKIPEHREGGMVWVGGKVTDSADSSGWSAGLLVSFDVPFYDESKEGVFKIPQGTDVYEFGLEFFPGEDTKKVYAMAYAENEEGTNYGLLEEIEILKSDGSDGRNRGDFWTGARPLVSAPGWWESWWFGSYYKSENGWWYHIDLGWIYPSGASGDGLWLWKEGLNWVWTKQYVYPFLFSHDTGSWFYFYGELNQKRMLYDYRLRSWKYLDDTGVDESKGEEVAP